MDKQSIYAKIASIIMLIIVINSIRDNIRLISNSYSLFSWSTNATFIILEMAFFVFLIIESIFLFKAKYWAKIVGAGFFTIEVLFGIWTITTLVRLGYAGAVSYYLGFVIFLILHITGLTLLLLSLKNNKRSKR